MPDKASSATTGEMSARAPRDSQSQLAVSRIMARFSEGAVSVPSCAPILMGSTDCETWSLDESTIEDASQFPGYGTIPDSPTNDELLKMAKSRTPPQSWYESDEEDVF